MGRITDEADNAPRFGALRYAARSWKATCGIAARIAASAQGTAEHTEMKPASNCLC